MHNSYDYDFDFEFDEFTIFEIIYACQNEKIFVNFIFVLTNVRKVFQIK